MAKARAATPVRPSVEVAPKGGTAGQSGTADAVATLGRVLGWDLTAVVAGVPRAEVADRSNGSDRPPSAEAAGRLHAAHQIVALLLEVETPAVVRAWFNGMNPLLDDRSPAAAIRDDPDLVLRAARAFRAYG